MEKELILYISAAPDMDAECELIGQRLAEMPRSARWVIKRTPNTHEGGNPDLEILRRSHFYLMLLGMDIVAPMGVEWLAARQAGLNVLAYRNLNRILSPAAAYFVRNAGVTWEQYYTPQEFIRHLEHALITRLIEGTPGYGLGLADIEAISARLQVLKDDKGTDSEDERRGAGRGGVILSNL